MYHLAVSDFDGTVARTFEPSPNGIDIEIASRLAVKNILGQDALREFDNQQGLRNRAPSELIDDLMSFMPPEERIIVCRQFIRERLRYTRRELGAPFSNGEKWPRVVPGYLEFYNSIKDKKIRHVIISSGHNEDIEKIYTQVWGIAAPIIFASESIAKLARARGLKKQPVKPSPLLMDLVWERWRQTGDIESDTPIETLQKQTIYIGDDLIKDGGLAANSGVDFVLAQGDDKDLRQAWQAYLLKCT